MNDSELLDESILMELVALSEEVQPTLFHDLVGKFSSEYPTYVVKLKTAIEANDLKSVEHLAHSLKGQGAIIGARFVAKECEGLEYAAADGIDQGMADRLEQVRIQSEQAAHALQEYLKNMKSASHN